MNRAVALLTASALALAACGQPASKGPESDVVPLPKEEPVNPTTPPDAAPAAAPATPARPTGPAEPAPAVTDQMYIDGASVTQVQWLPGIDAKVYSMAGGDPAINGLITQIAFPPESPDQNWTVFRVGDFESWQVVEQGPGRVVLQVRVSRIDPSSGNPVTEDKKLIVNWVGSPPTAVTVTPGA